MAPQDIVLVTGASGFIGSAVVRALSKNYSVVGLDRPGSAGPPDAAAAVDFDVSSDESVAAALEEIRSRFGNRVASVIHLAAYSPA